MENLIVVQLGSTFAVPRARFREGQIVLQEDNAVFGLGRKANVDEYKGDVRRKKITGAVTKRFLA